MSRAEGARDMLTLLKLIGWLWLGAGALVLWRNIAALSRVHEAIQPGGSAAVTGQVVSAVLVFGLPAALILALSWFISARKHS